MALRLPSIAAALACFSVACAPRSAALQAPGAPPLEAITILRTTGQVPFTLPPDPQAARQALAIVDHAALRSIVATRNAVKSRVPASIRLITFPNEELILVVDDIRGEGASVLVIIAHFVDRPGNAVLRYDGHLDGVLRTGKGDIVIRQYGNDSYLVTQLKPDLEGACGTRGIAARSGRKVSSRSSEGPASLIDVLVLYTPSTLDAWPCVNADGGSGACSTAEKQHRVVDALANALQDVNMSLGCSSVQIELRTAGIEMIAYSESHNIEQDVNVLADGSKGIGQVVKARRDATRADLVAVVTGTENYPGGAILFQDILKANNERAVSVTQAANVVSTHTLAHEIAHNMGAGHDAADGTGDYDFSRGSVVTRISSEEELVTILTTLNDRGRTRIPRFSGVNSRWDGMATGTPWADNARTLQLNRGLVASFRKKAGQAMPFPCPNP